MDCLHKLKDMIYKELDLIAMKPEFSPESLKRTEQLTHSLKSILTVEAMKDHKDEKDTGKAKTTI